MYAMNLAAKFEQVLQLTGHTRTSFAKAAGVTPGMISRLIPRDGRKAERTADTLTILHLISAAHGMLTIEDFIEQGALRRRPFQFKHWCPLCGHALKAGARKSDAVPESRGGAY
jgi:hypothetical protein